MVIINFITDKSKVIAFTKKCNTTDNGIKKKPRIFLGYKINGTVMKIGYLYIKNYGNYQITQVLIEIDYDIDICSIDFDNMIKRDITLYKSL